MTPTIEAKGLSRFYGIVMGLNNVSFEIGTGLTGLVGPNGAGKTTLIRLITGQIRPSAGNLLVFGRRPWNQPDVLRRIGYCPEGDAIHGELNPIDWLVSLGCLSGLNKATAWIRSVRMLDRVGLEPMHRKKPVGQFSKGMKQRVKLAQALLHEPDLLVLDEPMNGLDPMGRREVSDVLLELAEGGTHILISSHILPELESLCSQIVMMNWGRILAAGSQQHIRKDLHTWSERVTIRCDRPNILVRHLLDGNLIRGFEIDPDSDKVILTLQDPPDFYRRWTQVVLESQVAVFEIRSETRSLNQIFERMTT